MNALVRAIHGDLLALRSKHSWLSEYKETDLGETEGRASISYVYDPPVAPGTPSPQASDQIAISYVPLNYSFKGAKVFENSNQFRTIPSTKFRRFKSQLHGCVIVHNPKDAGLRQRLLELIERRCAEFQKR